MTSLIRTAKMDALTSYADGPQLSHAFRRGKWSTEEERYVAALMEEFKKGHLPVKEGMSMRSFLAKMLSCCPKRISKKFEGTNYNGKLLYEDSNEILGPAEVERRRVKLQELENKFEASIAALDAAAHSIQPAPPNLVGRSSATVRMTKAGPGRLNFQHNCLRGSPTMPGRHTSLIPLGMDTVGGKVGMGLGTNAIPTLAGPIDPTHFQGYVDSTAETALHPRPLRDMRRLSGNGRIPSIKGDSQTDQAATDLHTNFFGRPSSGVDVRGVQEPLGLGILPGASFYAELLYSSSAAGWGVPPFQGSLPRPHCNNTSRCGRQDMRSQEAAEEAFLHEQNARRRLMDVLSRSSGQSKRSSLEKATSFEDSKRRRMH